MCCNFKLKEKCNYVHRLADTLATKEGRQLPSYFHSLPCLLALFPFHSYLHALPKVVALSRRHLLLGSPTQLAALPRRYSTPHPSPALLPSPMPACGLCLSMFSNKHVARFISFHRQRCVCVCALSAAARGKGAQNFCSQICHAPAPRLTPDDDAVNSTKVAGKTCNFYANVLK